MAYECHKRLQIYYKRSLFLQRRNNLVVSARIFQFLEARIKFIGKRLAIWRFLRKQNVILAHKVLIVS